MEAGPLAAGLVGRCGFPAPGTAVDCAVSGGADSLALLVLAALAGCEVTAIHVDHGLRPGSAAEAAVVEAAARRYGARFRALAVEVGGGANVEARARAARYAALPPGALTGHTADDQAETVLLNLIRGAGSRGLGGMDPSRRPLLRLRRAETRALCAAEGLVPVSDPSNAEPVYRRNRVRAELLPLLDAIAERDVAAILARQADGLREEDAYLDSLAREVDASDARALADAPAVLARRALRRWLAAEAGGSEAHPPDAAAVDRVLAVARGEGRATEVRGGVRVSRSEGRLRFERLPWAVMPDPGQGGQPPATAAPLGRTVVTEEQLRERVAELGREITADYQGRPPLLVGVLKGAFMFMSDLARAIDLPVEFDFMAVSSYGSATRTSGVVRIVKDLDIDLTGRHVLLVEDIIDSGLTFSYVRKNLAARNPASLEVCALLVREGMQRAPLHLRYVGFHIPPDFVIGYGLDVGERYRNLPYVCVYSGSPPSVP